MLNIIKNFKISYFYSSYVGFSSDGASAFLKTMKRFSSLARESVGIDHCVPPEFNDFYFSDMDLEKPSMINDPHHLVVKIFWRLIKTSPLIGQQRASSIMIKEVLTTFGKEETGVSPSVIVDKKDAMNFNRAKQVCCQKIINLFDEPVQKATQLYLKMISNIIDAFIAEDTTPEDRVKKSWYSIFFCRYWKISSLMGSGTTVKNDFITSNAYTCLELNGHNLLRFLVECRSLNKPELFLLSRANSQTCESFFRNFRSMGTCNYTAINFTIHELLYKMRRVVKLTHIQTNETLGRNHSFARKKDRAKMKDMHVSIGLPSNHEIRQLVLDALKEAKQDLQTLGKLRNNIGQK